MIRTRFAPSPTGYLHVGGLRTALYCYLFAKKNSGKFILRIEDTDQERFVPGALENLIDTLKWMGMEYDEGPVRKNSAIIENGSHGPYIQSKRTKIYQEYVQKLLDSGHAYRCFCTKERLDDMRERQAAQKLAPMYDRKCLDLPKSEVEAKIKAGEKFIIRQKVPYETIKFKDMIRGNVQFDGKTIDDQVLMKSDGFPTYHLANVVDDHFMEITHVIRGEEWLPSTPKHIALYKSFGWEAPQFAHLPLLLNADRTKLSKRQGHVSVEEYIQEGYIREAILNFVAFLGWNPGSGEENEIFTLEELAKIFSMEKVHKSGAIFNLEKLDWFNWRWKKRLFNEELAKLAEKIDPNSSIIATRKDQLKYTFSSASLEDQFQTERGKKLLSACEKYLPEEFKQNQPYLLKALVTVEEKILKNPKETAEHIKFYFELPNYDKSLLLNEKMNVDEIQAKKSLTEANSILENLSDWTQNNLESTLIAAVQKLGLKTGQLLWPIRSALTGSQFSPGVFEVLWTLGKEESLKRIAAALEK